MNSERCLKEILIKIKQHQRPKELLLEYYIEKRLNKSLNTYYTQLTQSVQALQTYDEESVLKKLTK